MRTLFTVLIGVLVGVVNAPATTVVRDYQAQRHDRFYSGGDKAFIGDPYSFSGVGRTSGNQGRWATLVSDNFFISAYHYHPTNGVTVTFWETNDSSGASQSYTVAGGQRIGSTDLWVGWFNTPVSTDFTRYAVLELASDADYLGQVLYNYGVGSNVDHRIGLNVSDSISEEAEGGSTNFTLWFDYDDNDSPSVGGDETFLQSGDSGAPTFIVTNGQLALVGIHWSNSVTPSTNSIDSLVPAYISEINSVLATSSQALTIVPEPTSAVLVVIGGLVVFVTFRRK